MITFGSCSVDDCLGDGLENALVPAISRNVAPIPVPDGENEINDNAGVLSRAASQTLSLHVSARTYGALRHSSLLRGLLLAIASVGIGLHEARHFHHHSSHTSGVDPADLIEECIFKLTGTMNPSAHPAYSDAQDWFLKGPGKSVSPPELEECSWKTDFAKLFALLTLRAALNISTTSWFNQYTPIESMADICRHHWHRIGCSDNNEVVALHLSNGAISGTIPSELGAITTLKRIELYKNFDLKGIIPSELASLVNLEALYLHQTSLEGSLPSSLGKLTKLQELFVDDTKLEGEMPREICSLRATEQQTNRGELTALHADCGGSHPRVLCACCNFCYDHHRNHTMGSFIRIASPTTNDSVEDIKTCQENGMSQELCTGTPISSGEHCMYCTKNSPNNPDDRSACLTPTLAREAMSMFKRDDIHCSDGG